MLFLLIYFFAASTLVTVYTRNYLCRWNDYYLIFIWFINYLIAKICTQFFFIYLDYCSRYVICCFSIKIFRYIIVRQLFFYIYFIDWFFTCLVVYIDSFHLNYCSKYIFCCFTRSDFFLWSWHNHYLISSSLIDSLLAEFRLIFFSIWNIVAGIFVVVLQEAISLYYCDMIIILYQVHWLIFYLLRSVRCFFSFELF